MPDTPTRKNRGDMREGINVYLSVYNNTITINLPPDQGDAFRQQIGELEDLQEIIMREIDLIQTESERLPNAQQSFRTTFTRIAGLIEANKADKNKLSLIATALKASADDLTESAIAGTTLVDAWEAEPVVTDPVPETPPVA